MKKTTYRSIKLSGRLRFIAYAFIFLLYISLSLYTQRNLANDYLRSWFHYGDAGTRIFLNDLEETEHQEVYNLFTSGKYRLAIVEKIFDVDNTLYINLAGDPDSFCHLEFHGKVLLDQDMIQEVINEDKVYSNLTKGIQSNEEERTARLPRLDLSSHHVQLQSLQRHFSKKASMNGTFYLMTEDSEELDKLIQELSKITHRDREQLLSVLSGMHLIDSIHSTLYFMLLAIAGLVLFFVLLILMVQSYPAWSSLALLGWGRKEFLFELLKPLIGVSFACLLFFPSLVFMLGGAYQLSLSFLARFFLSAFLACLLVLFLMGIASLLLFSMSVIKAIKKKYSLKALKFVMGCLFMLISMLGVYMGKLMEGPVHDLTYSKKLQEGWKEYEEVYVLSEVHVGDDLESISGHSSKLNQDMIQWFQSFRNTEGYFLNMSQFYDQKFIDDIRYSQDTIYKNILEEPLWVITGDLHYAKRLGIELEPNQIELLAAGGRVYLYPSTWSSQRRENVNAFLFEIEENRRKYVEKLLPESVIDKLSIEKVFTWTSDSEQDTWTDEAVIELFDSSIADAIELRNLEVNGLSSLLKVTDPELVAEVTSEDYLRKFELDDNKIELTTVKDFSRNLRRTLISIIASFGMVIALLLVSKFLLYIPCG